MKKAYSRPTMVEYGRIEQLTLGGGGTQPDYQFDGGTLKLIANNCQAGTTGTACLAS